MQSQRSSGAVCERDVIIKEWSGHSARQLQAALRLTNEGFSAHLGVAVRTVAGWHERPDTVPRAEIQQALDSLLDGLDPAAAQRFGALMGAVAGTGGNAGVVPKLGGAGLLLRTAIAIVLRNQEVLLVCRRSHVPSWQFPAGIVKPESSPALTAVAETLSETGISCRSIGDLGNRIHPATNVLCEYVRCEYLAGEVRNLDMAENTDATWAKCADIAKFIRPALIFDPVRTILEDVSGTRIQ
jgi:8-oxo-dGTP diphosphatase